MSVKTAKRCLGEKLLGEEGCMGMTGIFYVLLLEHGGWNVYQNKSFSGSSALFPKHFSLRPQKRGCLLGTGGGGRGEARE